MLDIEPETLLAPISDDEPCGPDMEYELAFSELNVAAQGTEEREMGDEKIPAQPPEWREVKSLAFKMFDQTIDLRVAVHLLRSMIVVDGLDGAAAGLSLIRDMLVNNWDDVHPLLDADDDDDPIFRINSLLPLTTTDDVILLMQQPVVVEERQLGAFSMRDIKISKGEVSPVGDEELIDPAVVEGAFLGADIDYLKGNFENANICLEAVEEISQLLNEKVPNDAPDFSELSREVGGMVNLLQEYLARRGEVEAPEGGEAVTEAAPIAGGSGEIRSREDAIRQIDRVSDYFKVHEPSSPVPLLLERAKRLIAKDFVDILRDLTPDGLHQAMHIGGLYDDE